MTTYTQTRETNAVFTLQSERGTGSAITTRRLTLPTAPSNEDEQATLLSKFGDFRTMVLKQLPEFVQPASWRDSTGSDIDEDQSAEPYRTINIGLETVITDKTTWDGSEFDALTVTVTPSTVSAPQFGNTVAATEFSIVTGENFSSLTVTGHAPRANPTLTKVADNVAKLSWPAATQEVTTGANTQTLVVTATANGKTGTATITITDASGEGLAINANI